MSFVVMETDETPPPSPSSSPSIKASSSSSGRESVSLLSWWGLSARMDTCMITFIHKLICEFHEVKEITQFGMLAPTHRTQKPHLWVWSGHETNLFIEYQKVSIVYIGNSVCVIQYWYWWRFLLHACLSEQT